MFTTCLSLAGLKLIEPRVFSDERGFFWESYRRSFLDVEFLQDNVSISRKNTIRGLHDQMDQAKLVSVLSGSILDVAVDIRKDSKTFGQYVAIELDDRHRRQLFIPDGFAHGFCTLSESAIVQYKVSAVYNPEKEGSIRWNDPFLNIAWPVIDPILSERDRTSPFFQERFFSCEYG
ncbi:MAG: dTDP-4-dehydrorhamnose 3,5-epimerase [Chlamydiae bacterium]|nr:dTDP-4-dehydrorhamnose 3,5-epimerase [Chlamydiota bacterium]